MSLSRRTGLCPRNFRTDFGSKGTLSRAMGAEIRDLVSEGTPGVAGRAGMGAEIRDLVSEGIPGVAERTKTGGIASFKGPRPGTGHGSRRGPGRHGSRTRVDARHRCGLIDQEILPLNGPPRNAPRNLAAQGLPVPELGTTFGRRRDPEAEGSCPSVDHIWGSVMLPHLGGQLCYHRALELGANLAGEGTPRSRDLTPQWASRDAPQNLDPQGLPVPELRQHFVREWTPGP